MAEAREHGRLGVSNAVLPGQRTSFLSTSTARSLDDGRPLLGPPELRRALSAVQIETSVPFVR